MNRRTLIYVYVLLASLAILVPIIAYHIDIGATGFLDIFSVRYYWFGSVLVMLPLIFLVRFRLPPVQLEPHAALSALAHALRAMAFDVAEGGDHISVRVGSLTRVKLRARAVRGGTVISYQADATPGGWTTIIVSVLVLPPLSVLVSLFVLNRALLFVERRILTRLDQLPTVASCTIGTRALLVQGLSEGHRMALEAYEAEKSNYEDKTIITSILGLFLFVAMVVLMMQVSVFDGFPETSFWPVISVCVAAAVCFVIPLIFAARHRARPRILELKSQAARLEVALARETSLTPPPDGYPSSFELVADAWQQMPRWLESKRRAGMFMDPGTWLVIFILAYAGVLGIALTAVSVAQNSGPVQIATGLGLAASFWIATYVLYTRWRESCVEEAARVRADWSKRLESMQTEMERFLRGS